MLEKVSPCLGESGEQSPVSKHSRSQALPCLDNIRREASVQASSEETGALSGGGALTGRIGLQTLFSPRCSLWLSKHLFSASTPRWGFYKAVSTIMVIVNCSRNIVRAVFLNLFWVLVGGTLESMLCDQSLESPEKCRYSVTGCWSPAAWYSCF